jgi:hypothetical protein
MPPHFQPRELLGPVRDQRRRRGGKLTQQSRVGLELVLVKVLIGHPAQAQNKAARQPAALTNPTGKIYIAYPPLLAQGQTWEEMTGAVRMC